jgi:mannose-6-phosphate isomerase-like protein (cupin superfamily)
MPADSLHTTFLRLTPQGSIQKLPVAGFWPQLMRGELGDFHQEYLVSMAQYAADWPSWEMHPHGDEIVCLLSGAATMILEAPDGSRSELQLTEPGSFAFVPRLHWHTARIASASSMLFITPGEGTTHRPDVVEPA